MYFISLEGSDDIENLPHLSDIGDDRIIIAFDDPESLLETRTITYRPILFFFFLKSKQLVMNVNII